MFVARYTYDEWGVITSITDGNGVDVSANPNHIVNLNPLRYRSYFYDAETGWYWLNTRYYNPEVGRFINADGQISGIGGNVLGYNMYAYCNNNPINMSDTSGNWPQWLSGALNIVSGVAQMGAAAALGAFTCWSGVGAVAARFLAVNGAATITQGVGQVVNDITESDLMREDNLVRTGVQEVGRAIGGDTGAKIAGGAYDVAEVAAGLYAGKVGLQQAGKLPVKVNISSLTPNPTNPMTDAGINY